MVILTWRKHLAGDGRIVCFSEDERDGATWVYADCWHPWAAWRLLRHLERLGYPQVARRSWESVWLAPAEARSAPSSAPQPRPRGMALRIWWHRVTRRCPSG
jgi:hypothetical protein